MHKDNFPKVYSKFYLQGDDTCWRVEATDWISMPGVLEVTAVEYFANEDEDDIEAGIVGGLIEEVIDPNGDNERIVGETFIKPKKVYTYEFEGVLQSEWTVEKDCPVELIKDPDHTRRISVRWEPGYSG